MTNKDYSSDLDSIFEPFLSDYPQFSSEVEQMKQEASALLRRVEVDTLNAVSSHFDDLHQGTPGAGWVHYGEMGEWLDDRIKELEAEL